MDLGLDRAGFECVAQVEIDDFCRRVLAKHWPDVPKYEDIRDVDGYELPPAELIVGGFPCQPHSVAGEQKASKDERDLWSEFYRIICEIDPRFVLAENVSGLLASENGRFFGGILRDLAEAGYDAEWGCIEASEFGAPHKRERLFLLAYPAGERRQELVCDWGDQEKQQCVEPYKGWSSTALDSRDSMVDWLQRKNMDEPLYHRNGDGVPHRVDRLRGLGNAVVPQAAEWIGRRILEAEASN